MTCCITRSTIGRESIRTTPRRRRRDHLVYERMIGEVVLRPAVGRRERADGRSVRPRSSRSGGLGSDRAAVGGDRRSQRGAERQPHAINADPYGEGWLVKLARRSRSEPRLRCWMPPRIEHAWLARLRRSESLHRNHPPHRGLDAMLEETALSSVQEIFDRQIPEAVRIAPRARSAAGPLPEQEGLRDFSEIAAVNTSAR